MTSSSSQRARILCIPGLGVVRVRPKHIFTFPNGLIGFENLKEFVLVTSTRLEPLRWLIAVEEPTIGFPVLLPWHVVPEYELPAEYSDPHTFVPLVVVTTFTGSSHIVVNLKAPILLDVRRRQGQQLILPGDRYSATHPLGSVPQGVGSSPC